MSFDGADVSVFNEKTRDSAYVPKKGDIIVIEDLYACLIVDDEIKDWEMDLTGVMPIKDEVKQIGLSLARIEAEYVLKSRIQKRINELNKEEPNPAVNFMLNSRTIKELEGLLK